MSKFDFYYNWFFVHGYGYEVIIIFALLLIWWELRKVVKSIKIISKEDLQIYLATREMREKYHKMMKEDGTL